MPKRTPQTLTGTPSHRSLRRSERNAKHDLRSCGCLPDWDKYTQLSIECKYSELAVKRLKLCISEQCWSPSDIGGVSLTGSDRVLPYPEVVNQCLKNKLKNARSLKKEKIEIVNEHWRLLKEKHSRCSSRAGNNLNVLSKLTEKQVKPKGVEREAEIMNEVSGLISVSQWRNIVSPHKVLNLTDNEVSNEELEILSLGADFKLQGGNSILLDVFASFEKFAHRYRKDKDIPDLHPEKLKVLSDIDKDNNLILPRRYHNALKSIKANNNIKVIQSDKGRQVVICYVTTYLSLVESHYGNTSLYQPVDEADVAGHDLERMCKEFNEELNIIARQVPNDDHRKLIQSLGPPAIPKFPEGRVNLKTHKPGVTQTNIPVRPIVSNVGSPTSPLASYLGRCLTSMLGEVSDKHLKSTEDFANFINNCTTRGRILSLDVESLFTCIPKTRVLSFLRDQSDGWDLNPPLGRDPPVYSFEINSKIFCDLVELCLKYNQFQCEGKFYRQLHGLFMGSSISPPLAMMYLEYFEEYLYESNISDDIKATEWRRYVDDCFIVYEHSDEKFQQFLSELNGLDPYIKFTCEMSKPGVDVGLTEEVLEALPFLDLMVMRFLDESTGAITNKLSIYRKACHSGSYVHVLSDVPTSVKLSTIRNMFLRAYRYCDSLFLDAEESRIYDDFSRLGYDRKFINKARCSARKGRNREIRIREGLEEPRPPRERSRFQLQLRYHRKTYGLSYRLRQKGVDVTYSNRDSIVSRVTSKKRNPTNTKGGVYMLTCAKDTCEEVYVGQSKDIPKRLKDHADSVHQPSKQSYSSGKHTRKGDNHRMITEEELVPYRSNSITHRLLVETCLLTACKTVDGNKASAAAEDIDRIAPMVLKGAPINWKAISAAEPRCIDQRFVPKKHRGLFSQGIRNSSILEEPPDATPE